MTWFSFRSYTGLTPVKWPTTATATWLFNILNVSNRTIQTVMTSGKRLRASWHTRKQYYITAVLYLDILAAVLKLKTVRAQNRPREPIQRPYAPEEAG